MDTKAFSVLRSVKQGWPLAPYLFLFVEEALNMAAKHRLSTSEFKGITLPTKATEQIISQYADNVNFTIRVDEIIFCNLSGLIKHYGLALGLRINWPKNLANWLSSELTIQYRYG